MPIELVVGALGISNAAIRIGQNESVAICLRGEPGVQHRDPGAEAAAKAVHELRCEGDFRYQNQRLASPHRLQCLEGYHACSYNRKCARTTGA